MPTQPSEGRRRSDCLAPSSAGRRGCWKASQPSSAGRIDAAYAAWRSAAAGTRAFDACDPRRAASRTHLALCHAAAGDAAGDRARARRAFRRALRSWDAAEAWVARMAIPRRARSSSFHLRLESKHRGGYDALARAEFARLLGAGRAAALAGGAHLARDPAAGLEEAQALRTAGLSWRDADQTAIWRALAAHRQEAGEDAAAHDARAKAEAIERDPVSYGPERLGASRGRGGHERPQASRGGGLSDPCESSSSLRAGARLSRSACHQPMSRRGRLSSPSGRNITVRIRMAP